MEETNKIPQSYYLQVIEGTEMYYKWYVDELQKQLQQYKQQIDELKHKIQLLQMDGKVEVRDLQTLLKILKERDEK